MTIQINFWAYFAVNVVDGKKNKIREMKRVF